MSIENPFSQPPQESEAEKLEKRKAALRQNAEEILKQAKDRGDWVKTWTPEEDKNFIEGYVKTMEAMEEAAQSMPEETPPARINIGSWGREPKLGFEWTQPLTEEERRKELKNLGVHPSRKFE